MLSAFCKGAVHQCAGTSSPRKCSRSVRGHGIRTRRCPARPSSARSRNVQSAQGINPADVSRKPTSSRSTSNTGRPVCRSFSSAPTRTGATATYYPKHRATGASTRRGPAKPSSVSSIDHQGTAPACCILSHAIEDPDLMADALSEKAGRKVEILNPLSAAKSTSWSPGALRNARESLARQMSRRRQAQAKAAHGDWPSRSISMCPPQTDRGLRQLPHSGDERGRRR